MAAIGRGCIGVQSAIASSLVCLSSSPSPARVQKYPILQFLLFCPILIVLFSFSEVSYLIVHDHLLESRANHSLLSRLLAATPNGLAVGRLHDATLLALSNRLLQGLVHVALTAQGHGIGAADGAGCVAVLGVVCRDGVVGEDGGGGAEGAGVNALAGAQTAAGEACWQHCCVDVWVVRYAVSSIVALDMH